MLYCSLKPGCTVGSGHVCWCVQCLGDMALEYFIIWTKRNGDLAWCFVLGLQYLCRTGGELCSCLTSEVWSQLKPNYSVVTE